MPTKPPGLLGLSDAFNYQNGTVSFSVDRQDGRRLAISLSIDQIGDFLASLFHLARMTEGEDMRLTGLSSSLPVVEIDQLGVGTGEDPDRTILIAKIGAFDLGLSIENSGLS